VMLIWSTAWCCWLLRCCQHHPPGSVTKLLVSCLSPWLDLILYWPCCELLCAHWTCTPVVLKNRYYTWSINSMMQWQSICPSLRVKPLTLNLYSYSFV
jgi:hypothetical protein